MTMSEAGAGRREACDCDIAAGYLAWPSEKPHLSDHTQMTEKIQKLGAGASGRELHWYGLLCHLVIALYITDRGSCRVQGILKDDLHIL